MTSNGPFFQDDEAEDDNFDYGNKGETAAGAEDGADGHEEDGDEGDDGDEDDETSGQTQEMPLFSQAAVVRDLYRARAKRDRCMY